MFISERMKYFIQCIKVTDYAIFLKLDIINYINDIIIVCAYIPFESSTFYHNRIQSNGIQEFLDELLDVITPDTYMILLGDFNARTGPQPDYIIDDDTVHLTIPDDDTVHLAIPDWFYDSFKISHNSRDNVINNYGNYLLDLCKQSCVHILNGRCSSNVNGEFTFCSSIGGQSVVDYVLVSTDLFPLLTDFTVGSRDESDHFPISCELSGAKVTVADTPPLVNVQSNPRVRYEWDTAKRDEYRALLVDETSQVQSAEFLSYIERGDINRAASILIAIVHRAAYAMKCQPLSTPNVNNNKRRTHADWWSAECDAAMVDKQLKLRIYRHTRLQDDINIYLASKRKFKSICRQRQYQHKL